ncbi:MAG: TylF/MycF/NovP-related O-methyltransferase, partial [Candidatus Saccharibacteria bacterium]|nr:TylF/MycF/NovP-related O-methyltransferase [Candidatus Saccharibacteria bacterium]
DYLKSYHKRLFLYDSFEGLPEKSAEDQSPAGIQFKRGELLATKKQLITNLKRADITPLPIIKKAWFADLTPRDIPERISFAFLDGDYYHSILDPLKLIWPRLSDGAIVIVDDYASEALPGAARAVCDWQQKHQFNVQVEASLGIIRKNN